jgi:hypothetical protein
MEFFSWETLVTSAGATAFVLLVCQFTKVPLDRVWKIPTRLFVFILSVLTMVIANVFLGSLTVPGFALSIFNAFIVATAAMGAYELTFARK